MQQWNVRAVDAQGQYQILALEAPSQDAAAAIAQQRGLRVESVTLLAHGAKPAPTPSPKSSPSPSPATAPTPRPPAPAGMLAPRSPRSRLVWTILSLLLSATALIVAILALTASDGKNPLGAGLEKYDFKTPRAAFRSSVKMFANGDFRAQIELQRKLTEPTYREQLKTLEISKEVAIKSQGKELVVLFVSYDEDGKKQYKCFVMEKIAKSDLWNRTYYSRYTIAKIDKDLSKQMEEWERKS